MFNPFKYLRNRSVGIALGSGGSKGVAHISVLEYLDSLEIPISMISGSSIGAVAGALYSVGKLQKIKSDLLKMEWREMLSLIDPVFPRSGLIEGKKMMEFLSQYIPKTARIEDLDIPLAIVATDYEDGKPVVFKSGNVLDALRASISIPGVFTPVKYGDTYLIDGGVSNSLPIDVVKEMKAGITIAVNLHPTVKTRRLKKIVKNIIRSGEEKASAKLEIAPSENDIEYPSPIDIKGKRWITFIERLLGTGDDHTKKGQHSELPNIFHVISKSIDIMEYTNTMLLLKYYRPTVLIQPDLGEFLTLDFSQASRALDEGYLACDRVRRSIKGKVKIWI